MCYKQEIQNKNMEKLQIRFEADNVPEFIRRYFIRINSKAGAITYWIALKDLFVWLLEKGIIVRKNISEIIPSDFLDVEAEDVTLYLREKEEKGISPTTLETRRHIFSSFWEYLVSTKKCPVEDNVISNVTYRGIKSTSDILIKKTPTEEQLKQMEQKINKKNDGFVRIRNLAVFNLLKGSGIREGGLAGLDMEDLHLDEEIPYIKVLDKGKTREMEKRPAYLTGKAVIHLREWLELRKLITDIKDPNAVFLNKNGKRLNEDNIQSIFRNYGNGITPHMMRHWYATLLSSMGKIAFVQQQFGHLSLNTTIENYALGVYDMKDKLASM